MSLPTDIIHLYCCDINQASITDERLLPLLNDSERHRYQNFKNKRRQKQFGIARYLIKQILHQVFGVSPQQDYLLINYCRWQVVSTGQQFSISISHSAHYIAVAIADFPCSLGVDIEQHKKRNFSELLAEFSTAQEQDIIACEPDQQLAFYRLWTAKEAVLKASQCSLATVSQQDLSSCLVNHSGQVADYYYQTGHIAADSFSYCVMNDRPALIQLKQGACINDFVEPDVGL